jgi:prolyl-tRNA synthetase
MGARVLDVNGKEVTPIMGSYGIGIERILTAAIEQSNDANGFWLPATIAPFTVVVAVTDMRDALLVETGEKLAAELEAAGLDVLLDDRKERAGVKIQGCRPGGHSLPRQYRQKGRRRSGGTGDARHGKQRGCGIE